MSYTLHYTDLKLKDILNVLPNPEIKESTYGDHVIFTILWRETEHMKEKNDLYGVEVRFKDTLQGPNRGTFVDKKILQSRAYRHNIQLSIDPGHAKCWNGQSLLDDRLRAKGHEAWTD